MVVLNTKILHEIIKMVMSTYLSEGVLAHTLRWNRAGNKKAIGVHVSAPKIDKNLSTLSPSMRVNPTVKPTSIVLVTFLNIYLLRDLGHPVYR